MTHRYSTAFSHLCVAGCSIFYLSRGASTDIWTGTSYGIMAVNSLIGIWRWGNPEHGDKADRVYRFTTFLQVILALPCIATKLWIAHGHMPEIGWAHTAVTILPLLTYLADKGRDRELIDLIIAVDTLSAGIVSFIAENYWGVATAASYAITHFVITMDGDVQEVPAIDLYNYSLCAFAYFIAMALGEGV